MPNHVHIWTIELTPQSMYIMIVSSHMERDGTNVSTLHGIIREIIDKLALRKFIYKMNTGVSTILTIAHRNILQGKF